MSMQITPSLGAVAVVPSDATVIPVTTGLYVGGAGAVAVRMFKGMNATFSAVPVGTTLRIAVDQVLSTGTTATLILALYE